MNPCAVVAAGQEGGFLDGAIDCSSRLFIRERINNQKPESDATMLNIIVDNCEQRGQQSIRDLTQAGRQRDDGDY